LYLEFIDQQLFPELERLTTKYATWWTFKPTSSLKTFLEKYNYKFEENFRPSNLIDALLNIIETNYMFIEENSCLVIPDKELQKCFPSWMFLINDLICIVLSTLTLRLKKLVSDYKMSI
jgi:hypothetical protein